MAKYYTVPDVAKILGCCNASVVSWAKKGLIPAYTRGEKGSKSKLLFKEEDVAYFKEHRNDPKPLPPVRRVTFTKKGAADES